MPQVLQSMSCCVPDLLYTLPLSLAREFNSDLGVDHWTAVKIILSGDVFGECCQFPIVHGRRCAVVNCGRRETFEDEDANGVRKGKGMFCRAKKETAKEQLLVTRWFQAQIFRNMDLFYLGFLRFSLILFVEFFLFVGCCVRIPSLAVKVVL